MQHGKQKSKMQIEYSKWYLQKWASKLKWATKLKSGKWNWAPFMAKIWREPKSNTDNSSESDAPALKGFAGKSVSRKTNTPDSVCQHRYPCLGTWHSWKSTQDLLLGQEILPFCVFSFNTREGCSLKWRCINEWKQSQHYTNTSCCLLKYHFLNIKLLLEWPTATNPQTIITACPFPPYPLAAIW